MKNSVYLLLFLLLSSCCGSLIAVIPLTEDELAVDPYSGHETLTFIDNNGYPIIYDNGNRKINTQVIEECDGGFCCDYYKIEHSYTYFESWYKQSDLQVIISNHFDMSTGRKETPEIHFTWNYYEDLFTATSFMRLPVNAMEEKAIENGVFLDSLKLRQKTFYNVFTLPGHCYNPERLHADTLYYTKSQGIIGLKLSNGNLWVIK